MAFVKLSNAALRRICAAGAGLSMAALFAIIFVNSLRRYTIGKSFEWGEELPIYLGIYGMMFGAAYAYLQDRHIRFTLITDLLPDRIWRVVYVAVDLMVAACGALLAWSGYLFVYSRGGMESPGLSGRIGDLAKASGLDWVEIFALQGFWQAAIIVGGLLLALAGCVKFIERIDLLKRKRD